MGETFRKIKVTPPITQNLTIVNSVHTGYSGQHTHGLNAAVRASGVLNDRLKQYDYYTA